MGSHSGFEPAAAYRMMVRMRLVEEALVQAWVDGLVPGEYHSGIGEEAINAGVLMHLDGRDALALDHRNTAPMVGRGVDPLSLMLELLGSENGMNRGMAGHMHVMDPELRAAADGMVGAAGPLAVGNAVANTMLRPGRVAIAFHGEAAMNQGMLMESYNMAVAWRLPVIFVCKDNKWSITTYSSDVTGGTPIDRARGFGLKVARANGSRVESVYAAAGELIARARAGKGPGFLYVTCHRPGGHFEGDPLVRLLTNPGRQAQVWGPGMKDAVLSPEGATLGPRAAALNLLTKRGVRAARDWKLRSRLDPLRRGRRRVGQHAAAQIETSEGREIAEAIETAKAAIGTRRTFGVSSGGAR
ncbi:thiamine pyrophosphate-dependent dehydrogenase E1 component subunit alpha [Mycobacterium spongiae]|uniref:Thiamine pyrophosphate-dependent dehydrogenase E1 component subunit alpha n=1 Tax=Mycobacterium spongiae TaxID=886343 RepID=A0A975K093_9MYCO|nr:thiamine pyrophosphate-dependent dehydrogenase E1 component subunit alpha [Mycobacterium spongiae]QUR68987.1 thiamine pyrophosphate-dependent dehydrogenase E1 component subunit alpha [Mycobacterium spongiae]